MSHNPNRKLKPRADLDIARRLFEDGWRARAAALEDPAETEVARQAIVARLIERFPPADMQVLARYGFAKPQSYVHVRVAAHDPFRWDQTFNFPFAGPLVLPDATCFHAGGYRWRDEDGQRGLHPGVWERYDENERQRLRDYWTAHERHRVPDAAEPWFVRRAEANNAYKIDRAALLAWSMKDRSWADLAGAFPVIGEAIMQAEKDQRQCS